MLSVLAAPHALSHDLVMLAPVMVWGIALALRGGQAAGATPRIWARVATLVATWVVINAAVLTDVADGGALPPGQLSALALLLGVLLTCHELRRPRAASYAPVGSPAPSPSPAVGTSFSARAT